MVKLKQKIMFKKITLVVSISLLCLGFTDIYSGSNNYEITSSIDKSELFLGAIECPDCYGTLKRTYEIEYCVGQRCRNRELYRCNYDSDHAYWIYED